MESYFILTWIIGTILSIIACITEVIVYDGNLDVKTIMQCIIISIFVWFIMLPWVVGDACYQYGKKILGVK